MLPTSIIPIAISTISALVKYRERVDEILSIKVATDGLPFKLPTAPKNDEPYWGDMTAFFKSSKGQAALYVHDLQAALDVARRGLAGAGAADCCPRIPDRGIADGNRVLPHVRCGHGVQIEHFGQQSVGLAVFHQTDDDTTTLGRMKHMHPVALCASLSGDALVGFDADANGNYGWRFLSTRPSMDNVYSRCIATVGSDPLITVNTAAKLTNCAVMKSRGLGVHVYGSQANSTNANGWEIRSAHIEDSTSHGLYVQGSDSNCGLADAVSSITNGGVGIYSSAFLNSTFVACHADSNTGGNYKADGATNRSLFIGCYSEGSALQVIDNPSMVIGGAVYGVTASSGQVKGFHAIDAQNFSGFRVKDNNVAVSIGTRADEAINFKHNSDSYEWGIRRESGDSKWHLQRAYSAAATVMQLANDAAKIFFNGKLFLGNSTNARSFELLTALPATTGYTNGDRIFLRDPAANSPVEYILTAGAWKCCARSDA